MAEVDSKQKRFVLAFLVAAFSFVAGIAGISGGLMARGSAQGAGASAGVPFLCFGTFFVCNAMLWIVIGTKWKKQQNPVGGCGGRCDW